MKNVARHPSVSSTRRNSGVDSGSGPSSNVERDVTGPTETDERRRHPHADGRHAGERGRGVHDRDA